ncbi:MAG: MFS transporter [Verrucomicrobiales bacterium]
MAGPTVNALPVIAARNALCFVLFRIFFNCRFYYPIFTILFLDFGLTLEQFAMLNVLWAVTIVVLEVPSGALADQLGRRRLVVASAVLMVLEMLCLVFMPRGGGALTFWMFALNRVLSGAAEACASGADEALTYDSLPPEGREAVWQRLQGRLLRWSSLVFLLVTVVGAITYDAGRMTAIVRGLGFDVVLALETTMRIPLVLCLGLSLAALATAIRFLPAPNDPEGAALDPTSLGSAFRGVLATGRWIWNTPAVLILLLTGLLCDSFMRLFYSVASQFYRVLQIPAEFYGWIGAAGSLIGFATAGLLERLTQGLTPSSAYRFVAGLVFVGLLGLAFPRAWWGLWAVVPFWFGMRALHFFLTHHLNLIIPGERRATALSFRGLSMNLAYGVIMQLFGLQTAWLAGRLEPPVDENSLFTAAAFWWPWAFAGSYAVLVAWVALRFRARLTDLLLQPATPS